MIEVIRQNVSCRLCNKLFTFEAPTNATYTVSEDSVRAQLITVDEFTGVNGKIVDVVIHAKCPHCDIVNQYKSTVQK
ncbi:hypothetical protein [Neobacillus drentensis]|uniref:hypothetical protein n=1 Tax=Neobacillus drentensis TaxID=220684 RepID=UPI002FFFECC0